MMCRSLALALPRAWRWHVKHRNPVGVVTGRSVCAAHHTRNGHSTENRCRQPAEPMSRRTSIGTDVRGLLSTWGGLSPRFCPSGLQVRPDMRPYFPPRLPC